MEGSRIVADMMQFEVAPLFPNADGSKNDPERSVARLCRWSLDLDSESDAVTRQYIDDSTGEFPRIDERFTGVRNRHGFFAANVNTRDGSFDQLIHAEPIAVAELQHRIPHGFHGIWRPADRAN
jgi:carotenoid cleavage dioxygenase